MTSDGFPKVCAIRLIENQELVGIFWVSSLREMFWTIDECTDPGVCEYTWLPLNQGIMFPSKGAPRVPQILSSNDIETETSDLIETETSDLAKKRNKEYWSDARFTELLHEIFFHFDDETGTQNAIWKPCDGFSNGVLDEK